ncbi:periplasmic heavy metal sensor [Phenylobacterium hankyongense]|nr:periplasmic heavy metal sensor [Phenylobacterium hankyongense]
MSRRALFIALFASLALNLFVVGALAGAMGLRLHGFGREPRGHAGMQGAGMQGVGAVLSPEHREAWRTEMRAQAATSGAKLRQARMLRRGAWARFATDPFDAPAILADLDRSRALEMDGRAELDRRIVTFAGGLPTDERVRFAEALTQPRPQAQRGGGLRRGRADAGQRQPGLADR